MLIIDIWMIYIFVINVLHILYKKITHADNKAKGTTIAYKTKKLNCNLLIALLWLTSKVVS